MTAELLHWLTLDPTLKVVAVADGARDNWTFLAALCLDLVLLDFWHAAEHLKAAADSAFGTETETGTAWFEKWRHTLRHDANGDAQIRRELGYFCNNRHRIDDANAAAAGFTIGSGSVEAANKVLGL